jgi:hypothetical protein
MHLFATTPQQKADQQMQTRLFAVAIANLLAAALVKTCIDFVSGAHTTLKGQEFMVTMVCLIGVINLAPRVMNYSWRTLLVTSFLSGILSTVSSFL